MKTPGPKSFWWGLAAVAALYWILTRPSSAAAASGPVAQDVPSGPRGAPVPDLGTSLALEQGGLLNAILSTLRNGSSSSGSSSGTGSGASGSGSSAGTASSSSGAGSNTGPTSAGTREQKGPFYDWLWNQPFGQGGPPPSFRNPSGGFNSGAYKSISLIQFLADLSSSAGGTGIKLQQLYTD